MTTLDDRQTGSSSELTRLQGRVRALTITVVVLALAVLGLGAWAIYELVSTSDAGAQTAPFHAMPDDAVGVVGTATCAFSDDGVDPEGGPGFLVTCDLDMSDPRVSGTETHDRFRFVDGGAYSSVWIAEEAIITNAEGSWHGSAQAADDGLPTGEAHYVGEGAYEGLTFHYYFNHDDNGVVIRGWISDGE